MTDNVEVTDLRSLIDATEAAATALRGNVWWRGHSLEDWKLVPGVYRRGADAARYERNLVARFFNAAHSRHPQCPPEGEWDSWLFLMQHSRLPTRLLDWTQSALVAAYFAVTEHPDMPGAIWALSPIIFNSEHVGLRGIPTPGHAKATQLFAAPFRETAPQSEDIVAVIPREIDFRMLVQSSVFTIHGSQTALEDLGPSDHFLVKFRVPAAAKPVIQKQLSRFGLGGSYLFPDLEHLAKELASLTFETV